MIRQLLVLFLCIPFLICAGGCGNAQLGDSGFRPRTGTYLPPRTEEGPVRKDGRAKKKKRAKEKRKKEKPAKAERVEGPDFVPRGGFR